MLATEVSYSHIDYLGVPLDKKIVSLFSYKKKGTYIEVGANDGVRQSNTKLLEDYYEWTGILIEPSSCLFEKLCQNRPFSTCFECALGSHKQNGYYIYGDFNGHLMSSINGDRLGQACNHKVLVRSLQSILDEVGVSHIDFFSLDTEGYELNVLLGIDFRKTTFDFLLIEVYDNYFEEIVSFLRDNNYDLIQTFSGYNKVDNPNWDGTHNDYLFKRRLSK